MTLHAGHKAGLIGANGAGKSSLFALLRGELSPDAGDCQLPGDWRIAHMRQEVDTLDRLAVDYVLDGDVRLRKVQAELAAAEQAHDGTALARLHSELESADGYTADGVEPASTGCRQNSNERPAPYTQRLIILNLLSE